MVIAVLSTQVDIAVHPLMYSWVYDDNMFNSRYAGTELTFVKELDSDYYHWVFVRLFGCYTRRLLAILFMFSMPQNKTSI